MSHIKLKKSSKIYLSILSESSIIDFILLSLADILLYRVFFLSLAPFSQLGISDMSINFLLRPFFGQSSALSMPSWSFISLGLAPLMGLTSLLILFFILV